MRKRSIIMHSAFAVSAGFFMTACSSPSYQASSGEEQAPQNYVWTRDSQIQEGSGAQTYSSQSQAAQSTRSTQSRDATNQDELIIPLHEEQVSVSKRNVPAGQVTIRKIVTTETVNQPVQLRRERLIIDREGGSETSSSSRRSYGAAQPDGATESAGAPTSAQAAQPEASAEIRAQSGEAQAGVNAQAAGTAAGASIEAQADSDQAQADQSSTVSEPAGAATTRTTQDTQSTYPSSTAQRQGQSQTFGAGSGAHAEFEEETFTIQLTREEPVVQKNVVEAGRVVARKEAQTQRQTVQQQIRREDVQVDQGNSQDVELRGDFNASGQSFREPSGAERKTKKMETEVETSSERKIQSDVDRAGSHRNSNPDWDSHKNRTRGGARDLQDFDRTDPR